MRLVRSLAVTSCNLELGDLPAELVELGVDAVDGVVRLGRELDVLAVELLLEDPPGLHIPTGHATDGALDGRARPALEPGVAAHLGRMDLAVDGPHDVDGEIQGSGDVRPSAGPAAA